MLKELTKTQLEMLDKLIDGGYLNPSQSRNMVIKTYRELVEKIMSNQKPNKNNDADTELYQLGDTVINHMSNRKEIVKDYIRLCDKLDYNCRDQFEEGLSKI